MNSDRLLMQPWIIWAVFFCIGLIPNASAELQPSETTQVAMLGTGTPNPDPSRSGSAIAIIVNDTPYIVDFGPGIMRQAAALAPAYGGTIDGLEAKNIKRAFLTHLHSDHTSGYADLIFTPWIFGRNEPLEVYGPDGIVEMTEDLLSAYKEDINNRVNGQESANDTGWRVNSHAIEEGTVYRDENVKVDAFKVRHGTWPNAFGYRFTTPDRTIVISGDASPAPNLVEHYRDADILIHETYSATGIQSSPSTWQNYMKSNHTSTHELGELAALVKPQLLVLYHVLFLGANNEQVLDEVRQEFDGEVRIADDLDVY